MCEVEGTDGHIIQRDTQRLARCPLSTQDKADPSCSKECYAHPFVRIHYGMMLLYIGRLLQPLLWGPSSLCLARGCVSTRAWDWEHHNR